MKPTGNPLPPLPSPRLPPYDARVTPLIRSMIAAARAVPGHLKPTYRHRGGSTKVPETARITTKGTNRSFARLEISRQEEMTQQPRALSSPPTVDDPDPTTPRRIHPKPTTRPVIDRSQQPFGSQPTTQRHWGLTDYPNGFLEKVSKPQQSEPARVGTEHIIQQKKAPRNSSSNRERPRHIHHAATTGAMQEMGGEESDS
ncbi:sterol 3beta-glucosyltransferase [Fusarium circinatum]|uniref:Sterol 3beta-glucosyltransferase n=1 Tax=Fusarium circinatum TaxID=48490 RepID=A0A8H5TBV5_FUSCI|nr:sterol 3beta-glucosyltransferase [Fusarium circinatum]